MENEGIISLDLRDRIVQISPSSTFKLEQWNASQRTGRSGSFNLNKCRLTESGWIFFWWTRIDTILNPNRAFSDKTNYDGIPRKRRKDYWFNKHLNATLYSIRNGNRGFFELFPLHSIVVISQSSNNTCLILLDYSTNLYAQNEKWGVCFVQRADKKQLIIFRFILTLKWSLSGLFVLVEIPRQPNSMEFDTDISVVSGWWFIGCCYSKVPCPNFDHADEIQGERGQISGGHLCPWRSDEYFAFRIIEFLLSGKLTVILMCSKIKKMTWPSFTDAMTI